MNDGAGFGARLAPPLLPPGTKAGARIEGSAADGGEIVVAAAEAEAGAAATAEAGAAGITMGAGTRAGTALAADAAVEVGSAEDEEDDDLSSGGC